MSIVEKLQASNRERFTALQKQGIQISNDGVVAMRSQLMMDAIMEAVLSPEQRRAFELKFEQAVASQLDGIEKQIEEAMSAQRQQALLQGVPLGQRPY